MNAEDMIESATFPTNQTTIKAHRFSRLSSTPLYSLRSLSRSLCFTFGFHSFQVSHTLNFFNSSWFLSLLVNLVDLHTLSCFNLSSHQKQICDLDLESCILSQFYTFCTRSVIFGFFGCGNGVIDLSILDFVIIFDDPCASLVSYTFAYCWLALVDLHAFFSTIINKPSDLCCLGFSCSRLLICALNGFCFSISDYCQFQSLTHWNSSFLNYRSICIDLPDWKSNNNLRYKTHSYY